MITTARSVDQAAVRPSTLFRFAPAAVVISYLLIGIAAYWPAYAGISQRPFVGAYDFQQSVWFIAWIPHALAHGLNPFFSSALLAIGRQLGPKHGESLSGVAHDPYEPVPRPDGQSQSSCGLGHATFSYLRIRGTEKVAGTRSRCSARRLDLRIRGLHGRSKC